MQVTFGNLNSPNGTAVVFDDTYPKGWPVAFDGSFAAPCNVVLEYDYYPNPSPGVTCVREFDGTPWGMPYVVRKGSSMRVSGAEAGTLALLGALRK